MIHQNFKYSLHETSFITKQTQFGEVTLNLENAILFPNGLIGISQAKHFCLAKIHRNLFQDFVLLQGINGNEFSFLTLPIATQNGFIEKPDIEEACQFLGITMDDLGILLIASSKLIDNHKRVIVNVRAPVFIDAPKKVAMQYVIPGAKYDIQHVL